MRVLQIIDSLEAGGAERMAVNYANALSEKIEFSGIVATRSEGILLGQLHVDVFYNFLCKKKTIDFAAISRLKKVIIENRIDVVHAHGTSFFTAFMLKMFYFKIKIIFHEHFGGRSKQSFLKNVPILFCALFFNQILVVTRELEKWYLKKGISKVVFFANFASFDAKETPVTILEGVNGKRIVCLANLKNPKNHQLLLKAFHQSAIFKEGWSLHIIGKNYQDQYAKDIVKQSNELTINNYVYLYDAKYDVKNILSQATIGVLCSTFEGFPVTLLEYGLAKLPVISSNVGFCSELIHHNQTGLLFNPLVTEELSLALNKLTNEIELRNYLALNFNSFIEANFAEEKIIAKLISIYNEL